MTNVAQTASGRFDAASTLDGLTVCPIDWDGKCLVS